MTVKESYDLAGHPSTWGLPAMRDNIAPPTLNLDTPSVATAIDLVPHEAKRRSIDTVLSNSFGFGGTNASLIFRRVVDE